MLSGKTPKSVNILPEVNPLIEKSWFWWCFLHLRNFQHALQFLVHFQSHEADTCMSCDTFTCEMKQLMATFTSPSIRLNPILSNVRSKIKSHPLRMVLLTLNRTRRDSSLESHSRPSFTILSISLASLATPMVTNSL